MAAASSRRLRSAMPPRRACSTAAASRRSRGCDAVMAECTIWFMYHMVQEGRSAMAQLQVEAEATAKASPEAVWALVSDATRYPSWGPWSDGHYEQPGEESPHGVGAVQVLRSAQRYLGRHTMSVEKILEFEEDRHLAYTVIRGIPVRNYRADVTLTPLAEGTHI